MPRSYRWVLSIFVVVVAALVCQVRPSAVTASKNYKISPKPCSAQGFEGTCMFVWECIKSEGQHLGMCIDTFMFGSCCAHNLTENVVLPQTVSYVPSKPITITKKPVYSSKPVVSSSGLTTIQRPNGGGVIVVRPGTNRPQYHSPKPPDILSHPAEDYPNPDHNTIITDLDAEASISTGIWNSFSQNTVQWQMTTQPNFITKPKPSGWDKPSPTKNKFKPTKTKPQIFQQKPTPKPSLFQVTKKPTTTTTTRPPTTRPYSAYRPSTTTERPRPVTTTTTRRRTTTTTAIPISSTTSQFIEVTTPQTSPTSLSVATEAALLEPGKTDGSSLTISAARGLECGLPTVVQRPETRIVGGKNAPFGRWPWQVSVRRTSFFGFSSTHRCGGAILNANWIATAGHCVDDLLTNQIRIRVGEYDFSKVQEQHPYVEKGVSKKIVHPKYNFFTYEYDLALVKLETPLDFADHIRPICLPGTDDLLIGANATVTGWGRLSEGGTLPTVLQEVSVPIVSNDRCKTMFLRAGRHEFIPEIFLCAGHETGGQDSCQGDSGGPLQVRADNGHYFLAGIISWGIGCAEANLPGVCTRISKFVPWILENVA